MIKKNYVKGGNMNKKTKWVYVKIERQWLYDFHHKIRINGAILKHILNTFNALNVKYDNSIDYRGLLKKNVKNVLIGFRVRK